MTKANKTVAFRPSVEIWEKLQEESSYSVAIEKALKQYYGIEGVTAGQTPQSPIAPLMERLELLEEKLKISRVEARRSASENEDDIIDLGERVSDLEAANKKITARLENNPSHNPQEEAVDAIQVSEAITVEIEPLSGIEAERLATRGITTKELSEILDIPPTTLSDWGKRREDGKGKPSRGSHKDKWSEFLNWEKRDRQWYRK
jgi:DNA-binding transcriptional regulator YiaG